MRVSHHHIYSFIYDVYVTSSMSHHHIYSFIYDVYIHACAVCKTTAHKKPFSCSLSSFSFTKSKSSWKLTAQGTAGRYTKHTHTHTHTHTHSE